MKKILIIVMLVIMGCQQSRYAYRTLEARDPRFDDLANRVQILETQFNLNAQTLNAMQSQVDSLIALIDALQQQDLGFSATDVALQASLAAMQSSLNALQLAQNQVVADLAELQTHESVVEFIDPCGDKVESFDEVLVRTSTGKLVAYFESGSNRFLSILTPGNYRTTDSQGCYFTVNSSGQIVNEHL